MMHLFAFISMPAPLELLVLLVIAVLLFGSNLPEVARNWGVKYAELRRGIKKIEDEIRSAAKDVTSDTPPRRQISNAEHKKNPCDRDEPTAPKFEPPPE
jgi:sec-independent protein translocase protein TatA